MNPYRVDIAILGAGPAGYAAALAASQRGKTVAIVEPGPLGGTCLNWGCIPTKMYLGASAPLEGLRAMTRLRLLRGEATLDLTALRRRVESVIAATRKAMAQQLRQHGVLTVAGHGRLAGPGQVEVEEAGATILAQTVLLATGSRPMPLPGVPFGGPILDSTAALALENVPTSLAIVGGGAIGLEMAQLWHRLGTQVTVVEAADHLAPSEDPILGDILATVLRRSGITVHTTSPVAAVERTPHGVRLELPSSTVEAQYVLVAIGRAPTTQSLGLEAAGIQLTPREWIGTDPFLRACPGVYAVGDANGRTLLAHAAEHQARYAVAHALGEIHTPYTPGPIPACIYGGCELVRVGPSWAEIHEVATGVSRFSLAANPMAQAHGAAFGAVHVYWRQDQVVGIAAVGTGVSHLAGLAEAIVHHGWTRESAHTHIFAHPSLDEAVREALRAPQEPLP